MLGGIIGGLRKKYKNSAITDEMISHFEGPGMCMGYSIRTIIGSILSKDQKDSESEIKKDFQKKPPIENIEFFKIMLITVSLWNKQTLLTGNELWIFHRLFFQIYKYQVIVKPDLLEFEPGDKTREDIKKVFSMVGCFSQKQLLTFFKTYPQFLEGGVAIEANSHMTAVHSGNCHFDPNNENGSIIFKDKESLVNDIWSAHRIPPERTATIYLAVFSSKNMVNKKLLSIKLSPHEVLLNLKCSDEKYYYETGLMLAIKHDCESSFKYWLNQSININAPLAIPYKPYLCTPLYAAVCLNRTTMIDYLLRIGANPDGDSKVYPLFAAIQKEEVETIKKLLSHKANPNIKNEQGISALSFTKKARLHKIADILIAYGAVDEISEAEISISARHLS